jgi:tRNA-dihydrouridine synthase B
MDGVTDAPFRYITAQYGRPSVMFTEFTAVDGIAAGATRLLTDWQYAEIERPVVAQLFGSRPEAFYDAALVACALGFDGVDINMGCPSKNILHQGAGGALIGDPGRAAAVIRQVRQACADWANGATLDASTLPREFITRVIKQAGNNRIRTSTSSELPDTATAPAGEHEETTPSTEPPRLLVPVSVKTRLGITQDESLRWLPFLAEQGIAALTIHGRTLKQMYQGTADWESIGRAVRQLRQIRPELCILGNGDIASRQEAERFTVLYELDGVLIGRAARGNPWVFTETSPTWETRFRVMAEHAARYAEFQPNYPFPLFAARFLLPYAHAHPQAKSLRQYLLEIRDIRELPGNFNL